MPFSNARPEHMFSRMARVKNDYRNRLGRDLLDACLHIVKKVAILLHLMPILLLVLGTKRKKDVLLQSHIIIFQRENKCQVEVRVFQLLILQLSHCLIWKIVMMNSLGWMMTCELFFPKKDFSVPVFLLTLNSDRYLYIS